MAMLSSNKTLLFLLGLLLGLLGGAGFFIFKMDDIMNKSDLFKSKQDTIVIQQLAGKDTITEKSTKSKKDQAINKEGKTSSEMFANKYKKDVPIRRVMAEADSLLRDTLTITTGISGEQFIIKKDERIGFGNFAVQTIGTELPKGTDTLLEKVSGIRNPPSSSAYIQLEFWKSPLNYKGYKMTRNKAILFGIQPDQPIQLFQMEDEIFLKSSGSIYKLTFTDEFRQFEKIADPQIINRLPR